MVSRSRHSSTRPISTRRDLDAALLLEAIDDLPGFPDRDVAARLNQVDAVSVAACLDKAEIDHIHVRLTGASVHGVDHWATVALPGRDLFAENVDLDGAWVIDRTAQRFSAIDTSRCSVSRWEDWVAEVGAALDPSGVGVEFADHPSQEQYILVEDVVTDAS